VRDWVVEWHGEFGVKRSVEKRSRPNAKHLGHRNFQGGPLAGGPPSVSQGEGYIDPVHQESIDKNYSAAALWVVSALSPRFYLRFI
jgi:hypothetical protein